MNESAPPSHTSRWKSADRTILPQPHTWYRRILNRGIVAATTLGILELVLRLLGLTQPVVYMADEHAGYRLKPNQEVSYLGNTIAINEWGVRDSRELDDNTAGTERILVLGDSVTWGGIQEEQRNLFTSVLEHTLPDSQVVNCGVNGYSTTQMVELYTHDLSPLNPDRILVVAIPRDFTRPTVSRLTGAGAAFPQRRPRSAVFEALRLSRHLASERWDLEWLQTAPAAVPEDPGISAEETWERNLDALSKLVEDAGEVRVLVVVLPTVPGTPDADRLDQIEAELRGRNVPVENVADWVTLGPETYVDGVHLTTEGHDVVGRALAEILRTRAVAGHSTS